MATSDFASAFPKVEEEPQPQQETQQQPQEPEKPAPAQPQTTIPQNLLDQAVEETMRGDAVLRSSIANLQYREKEFAFDQRLARMFAVGGAFKDLKTVRTQEEAIGMAMTKIMLGKSMGMEAAEAINAIDMVKEKISISAQAQASRMKRCGYDWIFEQLDNSGCTLLPMYKGKHIMEVKRDTAGKAMYGADGLPQLVPARISFTLEDAKRAKLVKSDGAYETYPRNMYVARCQTNMRRWFAPESLNGVDIPVSEELREMDEPTPAKPVFEKKAEGK